MVNGTRPDDETQSDQSAGAGNAVPRTRQQARDWQCHECTQAFKKREHLVRHIRSHTKEKPFACSICPKTYGRRDSLIRHARSHSRARGSNASSSRSFMVSLPEESLQHDRGVGQQALPHHESMQDNTSPEGLPYFAPSTDLSNQVPLQQPLPASNAAHTDAMVDVAHISPSSHSSGYVQPESLAPSMHSNPWDTSLPPGLLSFGADSHEPFWLLGEDFDLDALNVTISATGSPRRFGSLVNNYGQLRSQDNAGQGTQANELDPSTIFRKSVQSRSHTKPTLDNSFPFMPTKLQDQDQVDETYRAGLSIRLAPNPHDNALPSADFLNLCIKLYFAKFQPVFPLVHAATFRPSSENALLLLSICSIGSLFVGSANAQLRGRAIFRKLNKAMLASWEVYVYQGGREGLGAAQSSALGQTYGMLSGMPNDLLLTESFHGTVIAWARQAMTYQLKNSLQTTNILSRIDPNDLESSWKSWAQSEETVRVMLALHIHDSEFAAIFHHEPLMRHDPGKIPVACSEKLFAASNATQWHALVTSMNSSQTLHEHRDFGARRPEISQNSPGLYEYTLLAGHVANICETRCGIMTDAEMGDMRRRLISWYETNISTNRTITRDTFCLMVLWHEAFMTLYANFDLLERMIGREGPSIRDEDMQQIRHWVHSVEGKRCIVHALLVYERLRTLPISAEPAIHVPKAVFYAGLVIYCHVKFRPAGSTWGDFDFSEVRSSELRCMLGPDSADMALATIHQLDSSTLYGLVDLLRRQGHWELSRRFASILEVLVDDLTDSAAEHCYQDTGRG